MVFIIKEHIGSEIVGSLDKSLDIFEFVCRNKNGSGVREIAKNLEISPSSVHKYLQILVKRGYLYKTSSNLYKTTYKIVDLSSIILRNNEKREIAHPLLTYLMEETGMTVHFALKDGNMGVYVDKIESEKTIPTISRIGMKIELYTTAFGKAILANLSDEEIKEYFSKTALKPKTKKTITSKDKLFEVFSEIRKKGYAVDNEENEPGIKCFGAPVFGFSDRVIGGISITLPSTVEYDESKLIRKLRKTAKNISSRLGCSTKKLK